MNELEIKVWLLDYSVRERIKEFLADQKFSLGFNFLLDSLSLLFFLVDLFPERIPTLKLTSLHVYFDTDSFF